MGLCIGEYRNYSTHGVLKPSLKSYCLILGEGRDLPCVTHQEPCTRPGLPDSHTHIPPTINYWPIHEAL